MTDLLKTSKRGVGRSVALIAFLGIMVGIAILAANFVAYWSAGLINSQLRHGVIDAYGYLREGRIHLEIRNTNGETITVTNVMINNRLSSNFNTISIHPGETVEVILNPKDYGLEYFESGVLYEIRIETALNGYFIITIRP